MLKNGSWWLMMMNAQQNLTVHILSSHVLHSNDIFLAYLPHFLSLFGHNYSASRQQKKHIHHMISYHTISYRIISYYIPMGNVFGMFCHVHDHNTSTTKRVCSQLCPPWLGHISTQPEVVPFFWYPWCVACRPLTSLCLPLVTGLELFRPFVSPPRPSDPFSFCRLSDRVGAVSGCVRTVLDRQICSKKSC